MDITENVEEIKDEDMMDEDDADDDSSEESSGDEVSDDEDVVKDKTEKGQAHHMFLRFMNPQICDFFFTKMSLFCPYKEVVFVLFLNHKCLKTNCLL